jgi:hypothetical protein
MTPTCPRSASPAHDLERGVDVSSMDSVTPVQIWAIRYVERYMFMCQNRWAWTTSICTCTCIGHKRILGCGHIYPVHAYSTPCMAVVHGSFFFSFLIFNIRLTKLVNLARIRCNQRAVLCMSLNYFLSKHLLFLLSTHMRVWLNIYHYQTSTSLLMSYTYLKL